MLIQSLRLRKKSANNPPRIGAIPAANELIKLLAAKYEVACPFGANLSPIFPDERVIPAVEIPIRICMTTNNGMVNTYLSGLAVKVHARMHTMNKGPFMLSIDLLLNLSEYFPHKCKDAILITWFNTMRIIIIDISSFNLHKHINREKRSCQVYGKIPRSKENDQVFKIGILERLHKQP